jgi:hypothetical protein
MYKTIAVLLTTVLGCSSSQTKDLRPFVAVAGNYSLISCYHTPDEPAPSGCVPGCACNGTGKEKSGDGLALVNCRCPDSCQCKKQSVLKCKDGTCHTPR